MMNFWTRAAKVGFELPRFNTLGSAPENEACDAKIPDTNCVKLDGRKVAQHLLEQCKILARGRVVPHLVVLLVGENAASQVYVGNKQKMFEGCGFSTETIKISSTDATPELLKSVIKKLNSDIAVHGILVQLPLPAHINASEMLNSIDRNKDVDGFLAPNIGGLALGESTATIACTPFGVMVTLAAYGIQTAGKHAVVVGRSNIVGKPMALLLLGADATVTAAHSKTQNLRQICLQADILVAAAGQPQLIDCSYVKPGAVVIDVGMHRLADGKLCGDVHSSVAQIASAMTPVPGGVGPMTVAMLAVNTALAAWEAR